MYNIYNIYIYIYPRCDPSSSSSVARHNSKNIKTKGAQWGKQRNSLPSPVTLAPHFSTTSPPLCTTLVQVEEEEESNSNCMWKDRQSLEDRKICETFNPVSECTIDANEKRRKRVKNMNPIFGHKSQH